MKNKSRYYLINKIYLVLLFLLAFSGFGQMPIFKRFYLADIPGLAWTADYFITHKLHYISSILLFAVLGYLIVDYLLKGSIGMKLSKSAYVRIVLMGGIFVTGIFRVLKNLPDISFSPGFTQLFIIGHLVLVVLFLITALVLLIRKKRWLMELS